MGTRLYHTEIGFPKAVTASIEGAQNRKVRIPLKYGSHARQEALADRYGKINLPKEIKIENATPIEVEVIDNRINKIVFRQSHDAENDIAIVVLMADGFVKTVWLNRKDDNHRTLNTSKYDRP